MLASIVLNLQSDCYTLLTATHLRHVLIEEHLALGNIWHHQDTKAGLHVLIIMVQGLNHVPDGLAVDGLEGKAAGWLEVGK